jgi:hypothetical protein
VQKIFKIVLAKVFDLKVSPSLDLCSMLERRGSLQLLIPEIDEVGEPILLYVDP